jgi:hypothetical protein
MAKGWRRGLALWAVRWGVDSVWEQDAKRLDARKPLENAGARHPSTARFDDFKPLLIF